VILAAYHERTSIRGLRRIFGVSRNTVAAWLKKASNLPLLTTTLSAARSEDVLELDKIRIMMNSGRLLRSAKTSAGSG